MLFEVHSHNLDNGLNAIYNRVFTYKGDNVLKPKPGAYKQLDEFKRRLVGVADETAPISRTQFLGYYTGRKLKIYDRSVTSLRARELVKADSFVSAFIKRDKENFTVEWGGKAIRVPRLIQPRGPRYNVELGKFIKPLERVIYDAIDRVYGETTVAKHLNADERGKLLKQKWDNFADPVALEADASRFDQHVSYMALLWEHGVYTTLMPYAELAKLLRWQRYTTGYFNSEDGRIKYRRKGGRCSGDMNTSLGNVLIMCGLVWTMFKQLGVKMSLLNDGDDCVIIVERRDFKKVSAALVPWFRDKGFVMRLDGVTSDFERIDFCQSRPIWTPGGYRMVRDPRITIDKDDICIKSIQTEQEWDAQRGAISACGIALAGDIPIVGAYYDYVSRGTIQNRRLVPETGMDYLAMRMHNKRMVPHWKTRVSFYKAFDITPDQQIALETDYDNHRPEWRKCPFPPGMYHNKLTRQHIPRHRNRRHYLQTNFQ